MWHISHQLICFVTSYMEIYDELVQDLLKDKTLTDDGKGLKVREHPVEGPYVESKKSSYSSPHEQENTICVKCK